MGKSQRRRRIRSRRKSRGGDGMFSLPFKMPSFLTSEKKYTAEECKSLPPDQPTSTPDVQNVQNGGRNRRSYRSRRRRH